MSRWMSPTSALLIVVLGFAGFAAVRSGWIPVEFGGASTGSIVDANSAANEPDQIPEMDADDTPSLDFGGVTREQPLKEVEPLELDDTLGQRDSVRREVRHSKWDELLDDAEETDDEQLFQHTADQKPATSSSSRLRLVSEEQTVETPKKTETPNAESPATEAEATAEPAVRIAKRTKEQEATFDFTAIDRQIKAGQVVEAHKALSKLYWQQPDL